MRYTGEAASRSLFDFWGYVLKLPVNTELARTRGMVDYNLPKWLTGISYREAEQSVAVDISDARTCQIDVTLEARKLGLNLSMRETRTSS